MSLRKKLLITIIPMTIVIALVIGIVGLYFVKSSTLISLEKNMKGAVSLAAKSVSERFDTYGAIVKETGTIARFSNPDISVEDKRALIATKVKRYGFVNANLTDKNGKGLLEDVDISDREYFKEAIKGNIAISDILLNKTTSQMTMMVAGPLWSGGNEGTEIVGAVYYVIDVTTLSDLTNTIKLGTSGTTFILDNKGTTIAHPDKQTIINQNNVIENAKTDKALAKLASLQQEMVDQKSGFGSYQYAGQKKVLAYCPIGFNNWSVGINVLESEYLGQVNTITIIMVALMVLFGIIASILTANISTSISRPLNILKNGMLDIANGNFNTNMSAKPSCSEIETLFASSLKVKENLESLISSINNV